MIREILFSRGMVIVPLRAAYVGRLKILLDNVGGISEHLINQLEVPFRDMF